MDGFDEDSLEEHVSDIGVTTLLKLKSNTDIVCFKIWRSFQRYKLEKPNISNRGTQQSLYLKAFHIQKP